MHRKKTLTKFNNFKAPESGAFFICKNDKLTNLKEYRLKFAKYGLD
jgi:hypothetical protein